MDYRELIATLRNGQPHVILDYSGEAADAIEILLAERDAAIKDIQDYSYHPCKTCIEWKNGRCSRPGPKDCGGYSWWKWRGPQKGGGS